MKGVLLFAFNSPTVDYFKMAVYTAKRANKFLNLPVTVVTDYNTDVTKYDYKFDNVIFVESNADNTKSKEVWINKGRHQAYELSPYDETLLIDVDYVINSNQLLKLFEIYDDFMCPKDISYLLHEDTPIELISQKSYETLWATIIAFKKTLRVKLVFDFMRMVEENYKYYVQLHSILGYTFRNDFALTFAIRTLNGQIEDNSLYMPWKLLHVTKEIDLIRDTDTSYYAIISKDRKQYCVLNDTDFHCLNKEKFIELMNE